MLPHPQHQHSLPFTPLGLVLLRELVTGDLPWCPPAGEGRAMEYQAAKRCQMQRNPVRRKVGWAFFSSSFQSLYTLGQMSEREYTFILEGLSLYTQCCTKLKKKDNTFIPSRFTAGQKGLS